LNQLRKYFKETTFGQWSFAMFFLALLSGFVLMIPFDVDEPYRSITQMLLINPYASWTRNVHYWSSQLFLLFLLLHMYEHFKTKNPFRLKQAVWFRLTLGLLVVFVIMFTGFLLRGDADTIQARQIVERLTVGIPLIGNVLAFAIFGVRGSFQLIYINHVATFTILALLFIFEHSRKVWPELKSFVFAMAIIFLMSFYLTAPLHDNVNPTVKGPWYFLGLQDLLHWMSHPQWMWVLIVALLTLVFMGGLKRRAVYLSSRRILLFFAIIYGVLTIDGLFFRGENWRTVFPWQKNYDYQVFEVYHFNKVDFYSEKFTGGINSSAVINGRQESCLLCHDKVQGFSASHSPETAGCFSCHGGNPFSMEKETAHKHMILIPGNLSNAERSCGTAGCHPDIVERTGNGLMATLSGMINVDRYVFNEQSSPDGTAGLANLHHSAADEHLKNLCVRCHLGNDKEKTGPVTEESRGGGCLACHLNYNKNALQNHMDIHTKRNPEESITFHPSVDLKVTNDHCFGCHSRSGRIATNYEGWHETTLKAKDAGQKKDYRLVEGYRVFRKVTDDVHHAAGMDCIDCHTSYELMGDGKRYQHQENQQDVSCADCHTENPDTISPLQLDEESAVIAGLRFGNIAGKSLIRTKKHKVPLINTYVINDSAFLVGKNNGIVHFIKPPVAGCLRDKAHKELSCSACHTSWAPTCIGCHNEYDPDEPGYNMVLNKEQRGSWVEFVGEYNALPPTLGVRSDTTGNKIIPVIPGMVLTINLKSFNKKLHDSLIFQRLFAPAAPHTTMKQGRSCKSCHNDPLALGYGKGTLSYSMKAGIGKWSFQPFYEPNLHDGLPEDAWIPFLGSRTGKVATRSNLKPFTIIQQQKILTVGACLTCHDEQSEIMKRATVDFNAVLKQKKSVCIMPLFR